jgi:hypothetical protein
MHHTATEVLFSDPLGLLKARYTTPQHRFFIIEDLWQGLFTVSRFAALLFALLSCVVVCVYVCVCVCVWRWRRVRCVGMCPSIYGVRWDDRRL